ncbi:putative methyltransferase PMT28 [Silene latifolia]|uniref:putative methyltransferase PMT28 n=1 Tax=Silene latifolia TaxID=37657 RepID=UPI003D7854AA
MGIAKISGQAKTVLSKIGRQAKIPHGLCAKLTAVVILGLCFIFIWSFYSTTPENLVSQRDSFSDIAGPSSVKSTHHSKVNSLPNLAQKNGTLPHKVAKQGKQGKKGKKVKVKKGNIGKNETVVRKDEGTVEGSERSDDESEGEGEGVDEGNDVVVDGKEEGLLEKQGESEGNVEKDGDLEDGVDVEIFENVDEGDDDLVNEGNNKRGKKKLGPVFDPKGKYSWKLCNVRSKHNYIPCIDVESGTGKVQRYRHFERSCPKTPPMCLVPLPPDGYGTPVRWPESKSKILYKNVEHPKLTAYIKAENWTLQSEEYLVFPQNQSDVVNGVGHYLESIEEMVPDIEWGKNVRVILDIGVTDSNFAATLSDKNVITLSLGLKDDLVDLAQVAIERGFPAIVSPFSSRRLPFSGATFDAIHCSGCNVHWHTNGGKKLLEINRLLRPGGYFILAAKHHSIEEEEAMSTLIASICWNPLTDKVDESTEVRVKIYQKPESNTIYELRRKKNPPLCDEKQNPDAAWYIPIGHCLHLVPTAIEQHGTEWPAEWPSRLESYPDWLNDKEKVKADTHHWKSIVEKSYLTGMGIDWKNIRNVMDMKAIYGGFAAALSEQQVWVMNVVPVHAPNTLPYIFERGLFGVYHDWCESFGTYPRSYDLLHVDHLFSRLKNRCDQPVAIVVEMDRILRPGGWVIVRDKVVILDPLEGILRGLNWDIRMTFSKDKEGILVAQKTSWRP